jgi:hypothetical protein
MSALSPFPLKRTWLHAGAGVLVSSDCAGIYRLLPDSEARPFKLRESLTPVIQVLLSVATIAVEPAWATLRRLCGCSHQVDPTQAQAKPS